MVAIGKHIWRKLNDVVNFQMNQPRRLERPIADLLHHFAIYVNQRETPQKRVPKNPFCPTDFSCAQPKAIGERTFTNYLAVFQLNFNQITF